MKWFAAVIMAMNQLGNALLGGNPDMSVSARVGYAREKGAKLGTGVCHVLDWLDPRDGDSLQGDHCDIAVRHHDEGNNE